MVNTPSNSNQVSVEAAPSQVSSDVTSGLQAKFDGFFQSLGNVLSDITALEVNTMVCGEITGAKFIPWETYRDVYPISEQYLERQGIHPSLFPRYLSLRKSLELEYTLLMTDANSAFYDPKVIADIDDSVPILTDSQVELKAIKTRLPNPNEAADCPKIKKLLADSRFLSLLRKTFELKAALDNRNQAMQKMVDQQPNQLSTQVLENAIKTDVIYAQTVIQLDGDIINRYSNKIFDHPQRDLILQIHKVSVEAGHREWRGLFGFVIEMISSTLKRGFNSNFLFLGRNQANDSN